MLALQCCGVKPTPPAARPTRRPRRIRRTRRQQPRPTPPAAPPDRSALVDCLRQLGHRVGEAKRLAALVPADVTNIDECIEFIYRKA